MRVATSRNFFCVISFKKNRPINQKPQGIISFLTMNFSQNYDLEEPIEMMWDESVSVCDETYISYENTTHDLFLQQDVLQYEYPIVFQGAMNSEECDMYYSLMDAQQNGGAYPLREQSRRVVPRDIATSAKNTPTSILITWEQSTNFGS
jgi:hypothetical protein